MRGLEAGIGNDRYAVHARAGSCQVTSAGRARVHVFFSSIRIPEGVGGLRFSCNLIVLLVSTIAVGRVWFVSFYREIAIKDD